MTPEPHPIRGTAAGQLVLASASPVRALLLRRAGLACVTDPAGLDEAALKQECRRRGEDPGRSAVHLAAAKAEAVSTRHPGRLVLGCDQLLEAEGDWLDKPADRAAARAQLLALSGRTHRLWTAAALMRDRSLLWSRCEAPKLTMRRLDPDFIDAYLDAAGAAALGAVGAYQLEALGIQLFERIEGDYFAVLGLPLLAVLAALRAEGVVP